VLRDPGFRVSDEADFPQGGPDGAENPILVQGADWILNLNAPRHARIRGLLAREFTARRIAGMEPAIARMAGCSTPWPTEGRTVPRSSSCTTLRTCCRSP